MLSTNNKRRKFLMEVYAVKCRILVVVTEVEQVFVGTQASLVSVVMEDCIFCRCEFS